MFQTLLGLPTLLACMCFSGGVVTEQNDYIEHTEVLVLGAGIAGVSAAKTLSDQKITDFIIIEGLDRIGGRIKDEQFGNIRIEVGANWIVGTQRSPLRELAKKYDIKGKLSDFESVTVRNSKGEDVTSTEGSAAWHKFEKSRTKINELYRNMENDKISPMSTRTALQLAGWYPTTPVEKVVEVYAYDYDTASVPEANRLWIDEELVAPYDEEDFFVTDQRGYSVIVKKMADDFLEPNDQRLKLNEVVSRIKYDDSKVTVTTKGNKSYTSDYVIVTFSLGVIKHGVVKFEPPLPDWKLDSLFRFQIANYVRIYLKFPESEPKFWGNEEYILYASERRGYFPVWQNMEAAGLHPARTNILLIIAYGEEANRLDRMSNATIRDEVMAVLRQNYNNPLIPNPEAIYVTRWGTDPFFMGTFSYWPTDFLEKHSQALQAPVGRVYFAGEAYHSQYYGYVHGGLLSGRDIAEKVVTCKNGNCEKYVSRETKACTSSAVSLEYSLCVALVFVAAGMTCNTFS